MSALLCRHLHFGRVRRNALCHNASLRWRQALLGAGDRDRTGMASLEGWGSAIELHPRGAQGAPVTMVPQRLGRSAEGARRVH